MRPNRSSSPSNTPKLIVIAFVTGCTVLLLTTNYYRNTKAQIESNNHRSQTPQVEYRADPRAWPLTFKEFPWPSNPNVDVPELPKAIPITYDGNNPIFASDVMMERLRILIQGHPAQEIREDLNRLIETNEIIFNFQIPSPKLLAAFRVFNPEDIAWSQTKTKAQQPALIVRPTWLAGIDASSTPEAWLVIYHEFQHYKQWARGEWTDISSQRTTPFTPDECRQVYWEAEIEAYTAECKLAQDLGIHFLPALCPFINEEADFHHAFFLNMSNVLSNKQERSCLPFLAQEAGHPHPEAWR